MQLRHTTAFSFDPTSAVRNNLSEVLPLTKQCKLPTRKNENKERRHKAEEIDHHADTRHEHGNSQ